MARSLRTASQRSRSSSQAVAMVSSSTAGFLGASDQGADAPRPTANEAGSTPRWREPGWRMFSMNAAEIRPPEVVMWVVEPDLLCRSKVFAHRVDISYRSLACTGGGVKLSV